ncbi:MAG: DoxX family membrane protein [Hoeflea sp.]|uniref:DoxX family protein n=1 Tax=Hoeflea sp. TaxID=1940281 RepID=UPI001DAFC9CB|nr:DoxX family membrane protein [Hoeflea sp.]MBU4528221.1 DoxX family membrane protein [Alphaproteobacteria bacterium]MBU4543817.1 DoxX family membrane protein [Alphaproteobacteria bacterium]MBU4548458.1 DoxX family membrane protein [Alphaproteobacteria bacterium]MBV1722537.1 DoxX family membrane protein [Hoeflea sp.]MBV1762206.1 DoxX family membrane protein [Hoeflea sp.]
MTSAICHLTGLHDRFFVGLERIGDKWLLGLIARFAFAAVLWGYFLNSAKTKVGDGLTGFFSISPGAYYQIALPAVEAAGGDVDAVAFFPWGLIVLMGTYAEFILPLLIVVGLFSRIAALGMIGFITVQTFVDITVHKIGAEAIGAWFDRFPDAVIADQRLLWLVPLMVISIKGPGGLSLDGLLTRVPRQV